MGHCERSACRISASASTCALVLLRTSERHLPKFGCGDALSFDRQSAPFQPSSAQWSRTHLSGWPCSFRTLESNSSSQRAMKSLSMISANMRSTVELGAVTSSISRIWRKKVANPTARITHGMTTGTATGLRSPSSACAGRSRTTRHRQAVYEPFSGSGTTIVAAEMTGRSCFAIEIDPAYVDVAVLRWQAFTGEDARLDQDGRSFAEVAAGRPSESVGSSQAV
jgi:hypothetical protein